MAPGAVDVIDVVAADRNRAPNVTSRQGNRTLAPGAQDFAPSRKTTRGNGRARLLVVRHITIFG